MGPSELQKPPGHSLRASCSAWGMHPELFTVLVLNLQNPESLRLSRALSNAGEH